MALEQRKVVRASGIKRRRLILEATLRVILRDGIRGVRHRAVAQEAQVPLASTTYYFRDIEQLLSEAFIYWSENARIYSDRLREQAFELLAELTPQSLQDRAQRLQLTTALSQLVTRYTIDQANDLRDERLIELAFHHEAVRSVELQKVVRESLAVQLQNMVEFYQVLGSGHPVADAQVTISVLYRLEQESVMAGPEIDHNKIEQTIQRHLNVMLGAVSLDAGAAAAPDVG